MAINWDQLWKQATDWGGDYDILSDYSGAGGVRTPTGETNRWGGGAQGTVRTGYDNTGRPAAPQVAGQQIAQPGGNLPASNVDGGGVGFTAPAPKVLDRAQLASLDALLSSLDTIRDQTKQKAAIKRDTAKTEKQREKEREEGEYKGKKVTTLQDFAGAKTDTDLNTRNTLENLMSSLSTMGLGGSRALTRQILDAANMSNRKANETQAKNNQGLDTAWNEFSAANENDVRKIEDQYGYDAGEAERTWGQNRQNILHKKADVYNAADHAAEREAVMNEANSLNSHITGAPFMNPSYTGEARKMATPDLADYQQDIARYDTAGIGANAAGVTPVGAGVTPGNLAIKAVAVNDKDLGVKKKTEGLDPVLGV